MSNPNNFIQNSDFASLKNDSKGQIELYIGASPALALDEQYTYESFLDIGTQNAGIRCQIQSTAKSGIWSSPLMNITLEATVNTVPATVFDYPTTAYVERVSPTRMRLACNVYGTAAGKTTTITGKFQTITADVVTFLSPFN